MSGPRALTEIASHPDVTTVMAAIVGAAGLEACVAAARAGKRLLLANKEALVVGGRLFMDAVRDGGATLLPIDSEHSAIFQCLPEDRSAWAARIDHIVLTASGGPFRTRAPASLHDVTPDAGGGASELGHGPQDLRRFGDDDEQGARSDRGALAVRSATRAGARRHPSAKRDPFDGGLPRPLGAGATRHARHARADRLRPGVSRAHRVRRVAARLRNDAGPVLRAGRPRAISRSLPGLGRAESARRQHDGAQRCQRNRGGRVPGRCDQVHRHPPHQRADHRRRAAGCGRQRNDRRPAGARRTRARAAARELNRSD